MKLVSLAAKVLIAAVWKVLYHYGTFIYHASVTDIFYIMTDEFLGIVNVGSTIRWPLE